MTNGQSYDLSPWKETENALRRVNSTQLRQHEIHDDHVGLEPLCGNNRLLAVRGSSDHLHVLLLLEEDRKGVAHDAVIVDYQDPDRWQHIRVQAAAPRW